MDEFIKMAEYTSNYVAALKRGLDKCAGMLPTLVNQHINKLAGERLNTTKETFLSAVQTNMTNYLLVVTLDDENWLANAVESGADPFNMKTTHLKSPKAKMGKPDKYGISYKYLRIPIGKKKDGTGGKTEKSQEFQKKINEVMLKPQFGLSRLKTMMDGSVSESQQVLTSDPDLQGLYRVRKFANPEEYHEGNKKPQWNLILFRTMSENPFSKGQWDHPGITPANIFRDTNMWLYANIDNILDTFLENEIEKLGNP